MPTEENKVIEGETLETTQSTDLSTQTSNTEIAPVEEQKSLLAEIGEWIVLALIIGLIWKLANLIVGGAKKLIKKFKDKRAAKKAAKEAQAQPTEAPVAAPVAAPAAPQEPVEGTENK